MPPLQDNCEADRFLKVVSTVLAYSWQNLIIPISIIITIIVLELISFWTLLILLLNFWIELKLMLLAFNTKAQMSRMVLLNYNSVKLQMSRMVWLNYNVFYINLN